MPMPPSTGRPAPVMKRAASEARNTTASAMSETSPSRPSGVRPMTSPTAASALGHGLPEVDAHVTARIIFEYFAHLVAVDIGAPQAVVDHQKRRERDFAGLRFGRQRIFGNACQLCIAALERAAIF